jgi:hypothetical protein
MYIVDFKQVWRPRPLILSLKPPLPDPLKTPLFFSQWAKLQNFFETRAERKRPLARVDQGNDSKTGKSFGCLTGTVWKYFYKFPK